MRATNSEFMLSPEQIAEFDAQGYIVVKGLYTSDEVERIKILLNEAFEEAQHKVENMAADELPACEKFRVEYPGPENQSASILLVSKNHAERAIQLISWIGGAKPELLRLGRLPKLTVPVAQLLRSRKADHLANQSHYMLPNERPEWHQDIEYRKFYDPNWRDINNRGSFVKTFVSVDPASKLIVIPSSHDKELFINGPISADEREAIVKSKFDTTSNRYVNLLPGDTLFMHPKLVHKCATTAAKCRKTFVNGFAFPGANGRPYPGTGSATTVDLNVPSGMKFV